jgi:hypothetical protein
MMIWINGAFGAGKTTLVLRGDQHTPEELAGLVVKAATGLVRNQEAPVTGRN